MDTKVTEMSGLKFFMILTITLLIVTGLTKLITWGIDHIKISGAA